MAHYQQETIMLDGGTYDNDTFEDCLLMYSGGEVPNMAGCSFIRCRWEFHGAASNTIDFMAAIYNGLGEGGRNIIEDTFESIRTMYLPTEDSSN